MWAELARLTRVLAGGGGELAVEVRAGGGGIRSSGPGCLCGVRPAPGLTGIGQLAYPTGQLT